MAQTQHLSTVTGVEAVVTAASEYAVAQTPDGLTFASPDSTPKWFEGGIKMSVRLVEFLTDIRLLRRIPLSYLVPDARLLPPESIRFFHVNQTWVDRVIDGVVSNTNLGTVDFNRSLTVLQAIRETVNPAPEPIQMTGMLIRSELVRRWPKMIVRAYTSVEAMADAESDVEVLRAEPVSRDIFIALFAGEPVCVHLREPFDGVRYGVELNQNGTHTVDRRDENGEDVAGPPVEVEFRDPDHRTLNIIALIIEIAGSPQLGSPREVALHLEQRPYIQVFAQPTVESEGSKAAPNDRLVSLHNGRQFALKFAPQALYQPGTD